MLIIGGLYAFLWGKGKELELTAAAAAQNQDGGEEEAREQVGDAMA
jgi:hypothetical protein